MSWVMVILGLGHPLRGWEPIDLFLAEADIEANGGRGLFRFTDDPHQALQFENGLAVFKFWTTQSKTHPIRRVEEGGDGKPNKPLTQFTIEARKLK